MVAPAADLECSRSAMEVAGDELGTPGEQAAGSDAGLPTQATPTLARRGLGAVDRESVGMFIGREITAGLSTCQAAQVVDELLA